METISVESLTSGAITVLLGIVISVALIAASWGALWGYLLWRRVKVRHKKSLEWVMLQVSLPRDNEVKIDSAEQMFSSFASIYDPDGFLKHLRSIPECISLEIAAFPEDIRFYIGLPKHLEDMVEKQIHGAYPGAQVEIVDEYNIYNDKGEVAFANIALKDSSYKPIKTYKDLAIDPLSAITSTMAKMSEGEAASLQIMITPAGGEWKSEGRAFLSETKKKESNPETAKYSVDQKELEAVDQKVSKPAFETFIRVVVVSSTKASANAHLSNIVGSFNQFNSYNKFKKTKIKWQSMFMVDFIYRYFPLFMRGSILTIDELATIFHFPNKSVETPHIHWLNARSAPAPSNMPTSGLYIGKSVFRGVKKPIYLQGDDRRRHMYIIGKTGVGKSEFLKDMILQDIRAGHGVCFIDPHDTIDLVLPLIPPERAEDVILFDPSDTERPMGVNMLEAFSEEQKHLVVTSIIGLMYKLFDPNQTGIIGPRFEHAVRNAMLTVMVEPGNTLVEVMRILTDQTFVQELLPKLKDPIIRRYWTDQIAQTSDFHKSETLDYITSKFGRFVTNTMMRNIIGQSDSAFSFRKVMDEGKILLISLAKGKIGEENSSFLGLVLIPKILTAAMSRQDIPLDDRRDFYVYVDEFQNFATPDFEVILSEARKYRLNLTVANQFIGQMDEKIKNAIFGNVGTIVAFRVGVSDANYLQHEFQPVISEADLINVEARHAYVKTILNNEPLPPFSMDLNRDLSIEKAASNPRVAELIRELSRLKFGKPKELVEREIAERSRLYEFLGDGSPDPTKLGSGEGGVGNF